MKKQFFLDFDGTITKNDVVGTMITTFCREGWKEINERWERKELSTEECARLTFKLFEAAESDFYRVLDRVEFDESFGLFVKLCKQRGEDIYILSDGYDVMIKYLLDKHEFAGLPFYANRLLLKNGRYNIDCPFLNRECRQCGTCKRSILQVLKKQSCQSVYVGDGFSDTCVIRVADVVFAKNRPL